MNKFKIAMLSAATAAFLAPAFASAEGMYVSVGAGYAMPGKKKPIKEQDGSFLERKKASSINTEFGASFGDFRLGAELSYMPTEKYSLYVPAHKNEDDEDVAASTTDTKLRNISAFVNGYYDIKGLSETFVPYVTAGVGFSNAREKGKMEAGEKRFKKTKFAYKVGLGSMINLSESVALDVSYRFVDLGKIGIKRHFHTLNGGVVFKF